MTEKISQKIVAQRVVSEETQTSTSIANKPLEREEVIQGYTYKIKPAHIDNAVYITINNQQVDGVTRPFEIFINTKDVTYFLLFMSITRLISAVWRKGGDFSFICEELYSIYDPNGGYYGKNHMTGKKGHQYPSILAEIGLVIQKHIQETCR
jgi:hypothetical protein